MEKTFSPDDKEKWQIVSGILATALVFFFLFNINISPRFITPAVNTATEEVSLPEVPSSGSGMVGGC